MNDYIPKHTSHSYAKPGQKLRLVRCPFVRGRDLSSYWSLLELCEGEE